MVEESTNELHKDSLPSVIENSIIPTRKSNRIIRPLVKLSLLNECMTMILEDNDNDPYTYKDAMLDMLAQVWCIQSKKYKEQQKEQHWSRLMQIWSRLMQSWSRL